MVSTASKLLVLIILSSLWGYIAFTRGFFSLPQTYSKETIISPTTETLILKEEHPSHKNDTPVTETKPEEMPVNVKKHPVSAPVPTQAKESVYEELRTDHSDTDESYRPTISPCITPMGYTLGKFDPRFNISKERFLAITKEAVNVWEFAAGTSLFTYDPSGPLTLNLVYDERQATTVNLGLLALEIENTKQTAENIRTAYEQEKLAYTSDSELFNKEVLDYQTRYSAYNEKVKQYNERGGATKPEYEAMMSELEQLKKEAANFESGRQDLLKRMEEINARVKRYNELVGYVNTLIRKSNSLGSKTFTEGRFIPSTNTIDIFQYQDETKLKRVLIHEFGHALGIGHVENVTSVMYSFNSGTTTNLSDEDKAALKEVCPH